MTSYADVLLKMIALKNQLHVELNMPTNLMVNGVRSIAIAFYPGKDGRMASFGMSWTPEEMRSDRDWLTGRLLAVDQGVREFTAEYRANQST